MKKLRQEDMEKVENTINEIETIITFCYGTTGRYLEDFVQIITDADNMAASLRNRANRLKERIKNDKAQEA